MRVRSRSCAPSRSRSCASWNGPDASSAHCPPTRRLAPLAIWYRATIASTARAPTTRRIDAQPSTRPLFAMAFSRFFGRGRDAAPPPSDATIPEATADEDVVDETLEPADEEALPEDADQRSWRERAEALLPTGASTGSKRYAALWGDDAEDGLPTHFVSASGCRVVAVHGTPYIDCTMALGSVALGYGEPLVTRAVVDAVAEGSVSALSSWREVEFAERLHTLIPCAERVQLLKSGAEATSAAVRLARTYTGRDRVVASGYLGWHDWAADQAEGV